MDTVGVVIGGNLVPDATAKSGWRTTHFDESDDFGVMGDYIRVHAAIALARRDSELMFILSGGKGQLSGVTDLPYISEVIADELEALGIRRDRMELESNSGNTYSQLYRVQKMIIGWGFDQNLLFISNLWQLARMQAMIELAPGLDTLWDLMSLCQLSFVSAEHILVADDPTKWKQLIRDAYASEGVRRRIALEMKGVADIMAGTYPFVLRS